MPRGSFLGATRPERLDPNAGRRDTRGNGNGIDPLERRLGCHRINDAAGVELADVFFVFWKLTGVAGLVDRSGSGARHSGSKTDAGIRLRFGDG